jgi:TP901 family phage tail tape measure protein
VEPIKLDGSEIVAGVNQATTALAELQVAIRNLVNAAPKGAIQAQLAAVSTQALATADAFGKTMGGLSAQIAKGLKDAEGAARAGGKKVAKALAEGLEDGSPTNTVKAQRQKLQAEYEQMVAMGARIKTQALQNLRTMGVQLFPDHRKLLDEHKKANADFVKLYQANAAAQAAAHKAELAERVKAEAKAASEIAALRLAAVSGNARAQITTALGANAAGVYSSLAGRNFGERVDPLEVAKLEAKKKAAAGLADENRRLAERSREVHAAFRGIAGAAGALFLTYGSLLPLTTAFFAASSIKESITQFKDLEYQLKFVQAVSEDTSVSIRKMMDSVTQTSAAGGVAPVEAAKGLRMLAQAGLTTQEGLNALPDILRLATIGELSIADAATAATGAVNAFGIGVDNIGRVSDVFAKAAAVSSTSVQSITESMRYASTVAERYKISVEDVGTAIVALAKRNITGSSAGTAITQLFEELATPRGEAKKVASVLGVSLFDPMKHDTKKFFEEFVPELRQKLKEFDPESQTFILNRLTNNRGAKALSAILGLSDSELAEIKQNLTEATGFTARAVNDLNDSVEGDLKKLRAAFDSALAGGGEAGSEALRGALQNLKEIVTSEAMQDALAGLVGGFTKLLEVVTFSIGGLAKLYDAGKQLLPIKELLEQIGALSTDDQKSRTALELLDRQIKKEEDYQRTLKDTIAKLREKLGLQDDTANRASENPVQDAILAAQQRLAKAEADLAKVPKGGPIVGFGTKDRAGAIAEVEAARAAYNQLIDRSTKAMRRRMEGVRDAEQRAELERQAAAAVHKTAPSGTKRFNMPDTTGANSAYSELKKQKDLESSARRQAMAALEEDERHKEALLKDSYERGALNFGEYQRQLTEAQLQASMRRREALEAERAALESSRPELQAAFNAAKAAGSKTSMQKAANDLEVLRQKVEDVSLQIQKLGNKDAERAADALTKALAPATEIVRNAEKELEVNRLNLQQELEKMAVKGNVGQLSEKELFVQREILRLTNAQADAIKKIELALQQLMQNGVLGALGDDGLGNPETLNVALKLHDALEKAKQNLNQSQQEIAKAANEAFDAKKVDDFAKHLSGGVADGLAAAGKDGGAQLRHFLEEELLRKPFRMVLQAVLQPVGNFLSQTVMGGLGNLGIPGLGTAGGVPGMSNLLGGIPGIGSLFGGTTAFSAAGSPIIPTADILGSAFEFSMGSSGTLATAGGGLSGVLGGVSAALPYVGLAMAAFSMISEATKGETRTGGHYGYDAKTGVTKFLHGPSGGDPAGQQVKSLIDSNVKSLNNTFKVFGIDDRVSEFHGAYESSEKGRGGVYSGGTLTSGLTFGDSGKGSNYDGTLYEKTSATSLSAEEAARNFATDIYQSRIQAIQALAGQVKTSVPKSVTKEITEFTGGQDGEWRTVTTTVQEIETVFAEAAEEAQKVPKVIRDLTRGIDAEKLTEEEAKAISDKIEEITQAVDAFKKSVIDLPFEHLKQMSFDAAWALGELAGGMDKFLTNLAGYYQNFFSPEEQRDQTARNIVRRLNEAGGSFTVDEILDTDKAEFRKLVEQFEGRTDDAGKKMYVALLEVAQAMSDVATFTEQSAEEAKKKLESATDKAFSSFQAVVEVQRRAIQASMDAAKESIDRLKGLFELLNRNVKELYAEANPAQSAAAGRAFIGSALVGLRAGVLPEEEALSDAISAARGGLDEKNYSSRFAMERDRLNLAGKLAEMRDIIGPQLTTAELQLKNSERQLKALDEQLEHWRTQIDIARGVLDLNVSMDESLRRLADALAKEKGSSSPTGTGATGGTSSQFVTGAGAGGTSSSAQWQKLSNGMQYLAMGDTASVASAGGNFIWSDFRAWLITMLDDPHGLANALKGYGLTMADTATLLGQMPQYGTSLVEDYFSKAGIPAFARGGVHDGGWALVGEEGPELAWMPPARVYSHSQTQGMLGGAAAGGSAEIASLRQDLREGLGQLAVRVAELHKLHKKWDANGLPAERSEDA